MILNFQAKLTVLYIAVHELNAGWGAETFLATAFEKQGHRVIRLDYRAHRAELSHLLAKAAEEHPDIILVQRGEKFPWSLLAQFQAPKVYFATEGMWNPDQKELLTSGAFDAYVAASRGTYEFLIHGCHVPVSQAYHIPSGFDSNTYKHLDTKKLYNVIAVWNWNFRRRKAFWCLAGIRHKRRFEGVYGTDCNLLVNQSRVVVNIHRTEVLDTETRLFELLPTTSAIVSEICDAPELFHESGIYWFPKGDWWAMRKLVQQLLADEDLRQASVHRNNELALQHTWLSRANSLHRLFYNLLQQTQTV